MSTVAVDRPKLYPPSGSVAGTLTVTNMGPGTVFHGPASSVSPLFAAGSLAPGQSVVLSAAAWFVTRSGEVAGLASVLDDSGLGSAQSGNGLQFVSVPGDLTTGVGTLPLSFPFDVEILAATYRPPVVARVPVPSTGREVVGARG